MKTLIKISCLATCLSLPIYGQQGDKKHPDTQKDPIPADKIPPAPFLDAKAAMSSFQLADGFSLENIAEDNVHQPVSLSFDADGRAWVVEMTNYMLDVHATDENKPAGRITVLEDTNGDGLLDKSTVFLDKLILPRACAVTSDGLLYAHQDQLFFIKRGGANGLTPEGEPQLVDKDYAKGGNAEHKANGLLLGRDNWYYNAKSSARYRRISGKWVKQMTAFRGQWGIAQDDAGRLYHNNNSTLLIGDNTRPNLYRKHPSYTPKHNISKRVGTNRIYPIRVNPGVNRAYQKGTLNSEGKLINCTAASGMTIYRGENFPKEFYGSAFVTTPCGNLVKAIKVDFDATNTPKGSFPYKDKEFLASTDEWFRPVNTYTAPDGTLWIIDMYMGLLQHKAYMTTYLRKQYESRGLHKPKPNNGRIYRVKYDKNEVSKAPKMSSATIAQLNDYLGHANGTVRDNAQRVLVERITTSNEAHTEWDKATENSSVKGLALLHTLWVYESIGSVPQRLILKGLADSNTDVVNSALELARLSDVSAQPALINFSPDTRTIHSYLYALGGVATNESHARAIEMMKELGGKAKQLEEVYISGLGAKVHAVHAFNLKADKKLASLLVAATQKTKVVKAPSVPKEFQDSYKRGEELYVGATGACFGCHGPEGAGQGDVFPPIAPSEWVAGSPDVFAKVILHGLAGPIKVNGKKYKGVAAMPERPDLNDQQIADIMTYVRHMKGNKGGGVTADQIKKVREATKDRAESYTDADLREGMK